MKNGMLSWAEARAFLHVAGDSPVKYRCPHIKLNKRFYYELSDLVDYKIKLKKDRSHISHMTGKTGMQALARTVIMFALVESQNPLSISGDLQKDPSVEAKEFLSEETWYTELLEDLAEWPDFFKSCKRHFRMEVCQC